MELNKRTTEQSVVVEKSSNVFESAHGEETKEDETRPSWDNKIQYIMAALGFAVGLGNIWRFPYLCKKNGGGAFILPYVIMLFLEGYPLYYLELALGQKIRKGTIGVWLHISPYLGGVGFASNVVSLLIGLYYNMILGWALFYLFNSFRNPLPWKDCPLKNGSIPVYECAETSPTTYFWYRETLDISYSIEDSGGLNWRMVLVLFVAWLIVFLGMNKGIKSSGKVMYFATSFPYLVLVAFFIRGLTLDGAAEGVKYMFSPDLSRLKDVEVWRDAATQIFFSLGMGYGCIIAYSSYNPPKNNCYKDAVFVATANCLTSIFASVTVFSILGFKAKTKYLECLERNEQLTQFTNSSTIPGILITSNQRNYGAWNCSLQKELDENVQGTGLAFIAFTEAILKFPAAPVWSVLFFFMLLNIGMSSEFGILQTVVTTVLDSGVRIHKTTLTALMCSGMFLFGLIFTQRSGSYFLDMFDSYCATISLLSIAVFEVLSVSYVYGIKRFEKDLVEMINNAPGRYWTISWRFTCPLSLLIILATTIYSLLTSSPSYKGWNALTGKKDLAYPGWAIFLIIILVIAAIACIPTVAILYKTKIFKPEVFDGSKDDESSDIEFQDMSESTRPLTKTA